MNNLLQRKSIVIPFTFLLFVWITAICIPLISPYSDDINGAVNFKIGPTPPSLSHWFGTDIAGRDMFTLTIYAGISSLKVGILSILIAVLIGMPLGIVAGLEKGWIENAIMRISDSFLAFPPLILPMLITAVLGPSLSNVIIGIGISWFPWYARIARAQALIISEQDLKITRSEYLPSATITTSKSQEDTNKLTNQSGGDASINDVDPLSTSIKLEQTLIDFGRGADYQKKKIGIDLAKVKLLKKEQDILYKAINAYSSLVAAKEKEEINKKNVELKISQLETDRIRLERGEVKLSDVAQSESSLAGAEAKYIQSQNEVVTSKLNYENLIGKININDLQKSILSIVKIPASLESAIELSKKNNHDIKIAELGLKQAEKDITIAKSDLAPTASLSLERSYTEDLSTTYDEREKDVLKATVTWPFFSGGKNYANFKKNKSSESLASSRIYRSRFFM